MSTPASTSRPLALGVLATSMLMTVLDGSIVTVAMPAIQSDLGFTPVGLSWVVNAYLIAFGSLLLLIGRLGDLIGRKRMFLLGTGLFTAACSSPTPPPPRGPDRRPLPPGRRQRDVRRRQPRHPRHPLRRTPRTRQGHRRVQLHRRHGASLGQVLGGVLTDALAWNWIFFINLPIGVAALLLALPALPADRGLGLKAGADVIGALLVTSGLMAGIYAVVTIEEYGAGSAHTLGFGALAVALLVSFLVRQTKAANPLMPLRILRSRSVSGANLVQMLMVAALFSFQILVALYLQKVRGYGAAETGLAMLPAAAVIGVVSLGVSARLIARFGERNILLTGLLLLVGVLGLLTRLPVDANYATDLLPVMLLAARLRPRAPRPHLARHVRRRGEGRGPGLRPLQHHPADRHGPRHRGPLHPRRLPHRVPHGGRPVHRRGPDRRLPPGLRRRHRARPRRPGRRLHRPAPRPEPAGGTEVRARTHHAVTMTP